MDPLSAIVGALVAGATAAAADVATSAVKDTYQGLKSLIVTRFKRKAAVEMVEEAPQSQAAKEALSGSLKEAKADEDKDVLKLAEALLAAIKQLGPEKLQRANITIGDVEGARHAIIQGLSAEGSIEVGDVTAKGGDAVISNLSAGGATGKNR